MYQTLLVQVADRIATVTINRPKALNAINDQVMRDLHTFFTDGYKSLSAIDGIVIQGAGEKAFVAGADIKEFAALDAEQGSAKSQLGHDTFGAIERFHLPVIAAIEGFALGGGCELAMACHMRVAGSQSRFGQPEVNLGLIPGFGGTQRLVQLVGKGKALELLLTADMIDATEAHRLGLVNHVTEPGEAHAKASEILQKIAKKGPQAVALCISAVNAYYDKATDGFAQEVADFGQTIASAEGKEGSAAFVEKRKPIFEGRG